MNYLTQYYKNLSEQLQEKVNNLQQVLDEGKVLINVDDIEHMGQGEYMVVGRHAKGKGSKRERVVRFYTEPDKDLDYYENAAKIGAEPILVDTDQVGVDEDPRVRGQSKKGTGLKAYKKEQAIAGADYDKGYDPNRPAPSDAVRRARYGLPPR
jgi:hypothetical protein